MAVVDPSPESAPTGTFGSSTGTFGRVLTPTPTVNHARNPVAHTNHMPIHLPVAGQAVLRAAISKPVAGRNTSGAGQGIIT